MLFFFTNLIKDTRSKNNIFHRILDFFIGGLLCLFIGEIVVITMFCLSFIALEQLKTDLFYFLNAVFSAFYGLHSILFILSGVYGLWFALQRQKIQCLPIHQQRSHITWDLIYILLTTLLLGIVLVVPAKIITNFVDIYLTSPSIRSVGRLIVAILLFGIALYFILGFLISSYLIKPIQNNQSYIKKAFLFMYISFFFTSTTILQLILIFTGFFLLPYIDPLFYYSSLISHSIFLVSGFIFLLFTKKTSATIIKALCFILIIVSSILFIVILKELFAIELFRKNAIAIHYALLAYGVYMSTLYYYMYQHLFSKHAIIPTITHAD